MVIFRCRLTITLEDKAFLEIRNIKSDFIFIESVKGRASNIDISNISCFKKISIKNSLFDKTEFNGFDLIKCKKIGIKNVSFIGSHLTNVKWGAINEDRFDIDRQMARQLKSINDAQGETVIANDFYALEMRLRSKELSWREHFGEKLVQNIHGLISNHSNDWALPTIWFFAFGFIFAAFAKAGVLGLPLLLLFVVVGFGAYDADNFSLNESKQLASAILATSIFCFLLFSGDFEFLAALVNPLNFKDSKDLLGNTNLVLIYVCRIIEVFIGYQIITAIRKNTRRK